MVESIHVVTTKRLDELTRGAEMTKREQESICNELTMMRDILWATGRGGSKRELMKKRIGDWTKEYSKHGVKMSME